MSTAHLTKNALAEAFKTLMKSHPINKISIKMITSACGVTRHTFYNHFHDIYELLGWIYEHEVIVDLEKYCNLLDWKKGLMTVLVYTETHKVICTNTYKSLGREHLERFLHKTFQVVLDGVIRDIMDKYECRNPHAGDISNFYSYAITGEFLQWINDGCRESKKSIAARIIYMLEGNVKQLILYHVEPKI